MLIPKVQDDLRFHRYHGVIALVDVNSCPITRQHFNVTQYPFLLAVKYGTKTYSCSNNYGMHECIRKNFDFPSTPLRSIANLRDIFYQNNSFFLINHYLSSQEEFYLENYYPDYSFYTMNSFLHINESIPEFPTESCMIYYRAPDRQIIPFSNSFNSNSISQLTSSNDSLINLTQTNDHSNQFNNFSKISHPSCQIDENFSSILDAFLINGTTPISQEFSAKNVDTIMMDNHTVIMILFPIFAKNINNTHLKLVAHLTEAGLPVVYFTEETADVFKDTLLPPSDIDKEYLIGALHVQGDNLTKWLLLDNRDPLDFVFNVKNGTEHKYIKSEAIPQYDPANENESYVQKLVGKTFHNFIVNSTKLPIILFYNSECNINSVMEKLSKAAEKYGKYFHFGFINIDQNEVPIIPKTIPSIILFNKNRTITQIEIKKKMNLEKWLTALMKDTSSITNETLQSGEIMNEFKHNIIGLMDNLTETQQMIPCNCSLQNLSTINTSFIFNCSLECKQNNSSVSNKTNLALNDFTNNITENSSDISFNNTSNNNTSNNNNITITSNISVEIHNNSNTSINNSTYNVTDTVSENQKFKNESI